jgi:hypothetical protein
VGGLAVLAVVVAAVPGTGRCDEKVFEVKTPRDQNDIIYGGRGVTDHSAVAGLVSLIIPGLGQAINKNSTPKIVTHLVIGLVGFVGFVTPVGFVFGVFHIWSGWDALIDRRGGYINGCVAAPDTWLDVSTGPAATATA